MRDLDLPTLQLFAAVCEQRSITRVAKQAYLVGSAISKRLAQLEDAVGTPLLVRKQRGMVPTPAGETLLENARTMLASVGQIERDMAAYATGIRGHVRMLVTASGTAESLADDLAAFLPPRHTATSRSACGGARQPGRGARHARGQRVHRYLPGCRLAGSERQPGHQRGAARGGRALCPHDPGAHCSPERCLGTPPFCRVLPQQPDASTLRPAAGGPPGVCRRARSPGSWPACNTLKWFEAIYGAGACALCLLSYQTCSKTGSAL